jgi:hypothetical protein
MATILAESGFFDSARTAAKAYAKIMAGRELGIGPMTALSNVEVIRGKVTVSAQLQGALLARSDRYSSTLVEATDARCSIDFFKDGEKVGTSTYAIEEAGRAGLTRKDVWKQYPSDLLYARALTRGIRRVCPDLLLDAAYIREEMGENIVEVNVETNPQTNDTDKITSEQLGKLRYLKSDLAIPPEGWAVILAKQNVTTARELTCVQTDELVATLAHRANIRLLEAGLNGTEAKGGEPATEAPQGNGVPA